MQLEKRLDSMIGKSYMYKTFIHRIISYEHISSTILLHTNKETITFTSSQAEKKLDEFLPVANIIEPAEAKPAVNNLVLYEKIKEDLPNLTDIIKGNIAKLQSSREYIPQAAAINESINSLVNLVKLEIMVKKLKGMGN